jgi:hypothetical protein
MEGDAGLGLCQHYHRVVDQIYPGQEDIIGSVQRAFAL